MHIAALVYDYNTNEKIFIGYEVTTDVRCHATAVDWWNITCLFSRIGLCAFTYFLKLQCTLLCRVTPEI